MMELLKKGGGRFLDKIEEAEKLGFQIRLDLLSLASS